MISSGQNLLSTSEVAATDVQTLSTFLDPAGVALIGATSNPEKLGFGIARNLLRSGYDGEVHLVNPRGGQILGQHVFASVAEVPDPVDLAVILVPAAAVPSVLAECGARGIRTAIISSGGFREAGAEGRRLEEECARVAKAHSIRIIGPNCIGIIHTHRPLDTTFLTPRENPRGDVAFISQSGAICAAVVDWASGQGFGLSCLISLGNQIDVTETEALALAAADESTRVLTMYLEGVADGPHFVQEARRISREKPIIALKVGRSKEGGKAVASHTGALAGQDAVYEAAFRRAGIVRAQSTGELFDWARALASCPLPRGNRVAVLTNAGGPGVTAVDAVTSMGMKLATLTDQTRERLQTGLPQAASTANPVDMLASAAPEDFARSLRTLVEAPEVDSVILIMPPPPMYSAEEVASAVVPVIHESDKPVLVVLMGEDRIRIASQRLRRARVADYRFPERAVASMAVLVRRHAFLHQKPANPSVETFDAERVLSSIKGQDDGFVSLRAAFDIVGASGINALSTVPVRSVDEAVATSIRAGFPVALKVSSPETVHKSDVGGLALDLKSEEEVATAFGEMAARIRMTDPNAEICVQPMVFGGLELAIGAVRDAQFGPVVMFGSGGTNVEALADVVFGLAPLTEDDIRTMLSETFAGKQLSGERSRYRSGKDQVEKAMIRLGTLLNEVPSIADIEINPLIVPADGGAVVAVDARVRLTRSDLRSKI